MSTPAPGVSATQPLRAAVRQVAADLEGIVTKPIPVIPGDPTTAAALAQHELAVSFVERLYRAVGRPAETSEEAGRG